MNLSPQHRAALLATARTTIRHALAGAAEPPSVCDDPILLQPAGCFVSLHRQHDRGLRGCVGQLEAAEPLLLAVASAARSVLDDPRFRREKVTGDELPMLEIELSALSPIRAAGHVLDFDPMTDGIILGVDGRSGCFLPQVAKETGWTREQLLSRLCIEKLGMPEHSWREEPMRLSVFTAIVIGPEPFGG
ncbi:MAG: hypothetical protein JWN24_987 [Phycisphaerales bacterium]|nr:hypothetical protein [Phycisphaerales bacterium]